MGPDQKLITQDLCRVDAIDFMINEECVKKSSTMFNDKTQQIANQRQT